MRTATLFAIAALVGAAIAFAQDGIPPAPKSAVAKAALAVFAKDKGDLDTAYADQLTKARAKLIAALQDARKAAIVASDLDEAQAVLQLIKATEGDVLKVVPPNEPEAKAEPEVKGRITAKELNGRKFEYQNVARNGVITLLPNGKVDGADGFTWSLTQDGKILWTWQGQPQWRYDLTRQGKFIYGLGSYPGMPQHGWRALREVP